MSFINTDGLSFIGPGSEWFWTAFQGVIVALTLWGCSVRSASRLPSRCVRTSRTFRRSGNQNGCSAIG